MESLGYGTQLILDGFSADAERLQDKHVVTACLNEVAGLLEPTQADMLSVNDPSGISVVLRLNESHVSLHTHTTTLSLQIFSRHDVPLSEVSGLLTKHFGVRRLESFLSNHAKTMPQDVATRQKVLAGDRAYSSLRLEVG